MWAEETMASLRARLKVSVEAAMDELKRLSDEDLSFLCTEVHREIYTRHMEANRPHRVVLADRRRRSGMSRSQVAAAVGVPINYVSWFENDLPMPERARRQLESWYDRQPWGAEA